MNHHQLSVEDQTFQQQVESCEYPVDAFNHRAHLRLAYIYLVLTGDSELTVGKTRKTLCQLLQHAGIEPSEKYHETLTKAWVLVVNSFLQKTAKAQFADDFIDQHPSLLKPGLMLNHYSADRLYSHRARQHYLEPDIQPITG